MRSYYVYLITNQNNTALYTGMTNNLELRVKQHKEKLNSGFTKKYNCNKLVYFEKHPTAISAINREKQIKSGSRQKKNELVDAMNPLWSDLSKDWE